MVLSKKSCALFVIPWMVLASGCQQKKSDTSDTPPLILDLPTDPAGIFAYVDSSLKSSLEGGGDTTNSAVALLSPGSVVLNSSLALLDGGGGGGGGGMAPLGEATKYCNQEADPISTDASKNVQKPAVPGLVAALPVTAADYSAGKLFCLMTYPAESPDTAPGSYVIGRLFTCLTDGKLVFDGQPHDIEIIDIASSECVPPGIKSTIPANTNVTVTVTASKPAAFGGSGWDSSLEITVEGLTRKLLFKSSDQTVAVAGNMPPDAAPTYPVDSFSLFVAPAEGTLRYEGRFRRDVLQQNPYIRHLRMLATGTMGADGKFTALDRFSGIYSNAGKQTSSDTTFTNAEIHTVDGNVTKGFKSHGYLCGYDGSSCGTLLSKSDLTPVNNEQNCYGGDSTCAGYGLALSADSDLGFFLNSAFTPSPVTSLEWFETGGPLSFTEVTFADHQ